MVGVLGSGDPDRIGDYRLLGRLGEGGMGRVYLARSVRGRMVAVKTIRAEFARVADFRRRFAREIDAARRVGGEWTAPVLDADPEAAVPWVATGFVAGPDLYRTVAVEYGPLPEASLWGLASGLCRALGDIHGAGLVHRDLKPSNILVTIGGPRVIDFGIVRALEASTAGGLTATGSVVGSPGFMSPEQIRGEPLTGASDVFSLGAVLVFAATGRLAFGTADAGVHALMYRVVAEPPDLTGVPEALAGLVGRCLAKEPGDRPGLAELRAHPMAGGEVTGTWLPPEVLAMLGQEAVRLLDSEDPGSPILSTAPALPGRPPPSAPALPDRPAAAPEASPPTATATPAPVPGDGPVMDPVTPGRSTDGEPAAYTADRPSATIPELPAPAAVPDRRRGRRRRRAVVALVALGVIGATLIGLWQWVQSQYFIGVDSGRVAVYQGVSQNLGWISLSERRVVYPEIEVKYLPEFQRRNLEETIAADDLASAVARAESLGIQASACKKGLADREGGGSGAPSTLTEEEARLLNLCEG
ncbi:serine/threonine-protein kinase [Streptomyces sp. NPDC004838]